MHSMSHPIKKVAISQSNYIPWKGYFDMIAAVDAFVLYDEMQFTRRDWRNRNKIKTKDGVQWLTVPVEVKGKYFQSIRDTRIAGTDWRRSHWQTLSQSYARASFFKDYEDTFRRLYLETETDSLSDLNFHFITAVCGLLGIETPIYSSADFTLADGKTERLVELCKQLGATDYLSGPAAKDYIQPHLFEQADIHLHYFDYSGYLPYRQLHGAFVHEVSVLDLLFNEGADARRYLKTFQPDDACYEKI